MMRSWKGSPIEMEGMNSLLGLVCLLPGIIGIVDAFDPCINDPAIFLLFLQLKIFVLNNFHFLKEELKS